MTIKVELNDEEKKLFKKIEDITDVDYEIKGNYIDADLLMYALKDMKYEYNKLVEKVKMLEESIEEDYEPKKIDYYDYFGVSKSDFY